MHAIDWCIIVGYFALVIGVSTWVTKRNKNTTDDYFLAGRNLAWWVIGASIFSSNIGSEHLVGLAGSGATDGVAMAHYELHAWCVLILGWVLIPFFMRGKVFTMPEFLERRFSPGCRTFLAMVSLISYVLTKVAVGIFAGGVVFSALMPEMHLGPLDSFWVGSIIVLGMAGIYVFMGGMRAVAYTDVLQVSVLVLGSALLTFFGLKALGGWDVLKDTLGSEMFNLWKPLIPAGVLVRFPAVAVLPDGSQRLCRLTGPARRRDADDSSFRRPPGAVPPWSRRGTTPPNPVRSGRRAAADGRSAPDCRAAPFPPR